MATHFEEFGKWLGHKVGEQKAAITVNRYLSFFLDIEKQWQGIPDYADLLKHFGALHLRRVLLPMRWLQESGLVVPDSATREDDSDRRRILATLDKVGTDTPEKTLLQGYYQHLMTEIKDEKTTLRSVRLALTPAAALLIKGREMKMSPPNQKVLDAYLDTTPGQRAGVSGFVNYLRQTHGLDAVLPKINAGKVQRNRRKKLEAEMLELMREGGRGEEFQRRWISVALGYFHGLSKRATKLVVENTLARRNAAGIIIELEGKTYWLPKEF